MVIIISVVTVFVVMFTIAVVLMIIGRIRGTLSVLYMTAYALYKVTQIAILPCYSCKFFLLKTLHS